MTDPISQQQLITGGGKADPVYIDDVFNPYLWVGSGAGSADYDFQPSGIQFNNNNKGESVEFHYGVGGSGGDYLLTPSSSDYSVGTGDYTLEYWMYTSFSATHQIVDARMNGESYSTNWCTYTNTSNQHILFITGADRITNNTTLNDNTWYHIAIVRDSGLHKMFIDGVQQTQTFNDSQNFPSTQLTIGSNGTNRSSSSFDGHLSNVRFVKGTAVYTSNFTPPTENLTNITNTKLLCCQSSVSAIITTVGTVTRPGNINDTQATTFGPFTGEDAEGGMVWIKNRETAVNHALADSVRGSTNYLIPNEDSPSTADGAIVPLMSFGGFSVGNNSAVNEVNKKIVSWSFGKKKNFFDIVTWNGNATNRTIAHNLGSVPGCIFVKRTDVSANWMVYHRKLNDGVNPANYQLHLNTNAVEAAAPTVFNNTEPTATEFSVGTHYDVNGNGGTFVAYLFAHDQASFGENSNQSIIACDNYTGNGSGGELGPDINIGWQPQWVMIKPVDQNATNSWLIYDTMRGIGEDPANDFYLQANTNGDEQRAENFLEVSSTGFKLTDGTGTATNQNGTKYIYIAIRGRDGLVCKPPLLGSDVFSVNVGSGAGTNQGFPGWYSGFPVDMGIWRRYQSNEGWHLFPRLFNGYYLRTNTNSSRNSYGTMARQDSNIGWGETSSWDSAYMAWMWKRYAGFDMIPYLGDGNAGRTLSHSMGTVPEMIWVKNAHGASDWAVYHVGANDGTTPQNYSLRLDHDGANTTNSTYWNDTAPTKTQITLGTSGNVNGNGDDYIAMVFSSVEGMSKCGYYSGSTSDTTVDLGFTPRFLIIKSANSTGDWLVFDYYRGLASDTAGFGESSFTTHGSHTWTAPAGVTSVHVVAVGGGGCGNLYQNGYNTGGGGGGLGWKNNITVTPGNSYTVVVGQGGQRSYQGGPGNNGGDSYFINTSTVKGGGGYGANPNNAGGGNYTGDGGGNGGRGCNITNKNPVGGIVGSGGGAGGYSGNGGDGGANANGSPSDGQAGNGGGGAGGGASGGSYGAGGGVGIFGEGASGPAGGVGSTGQGHPGSGGVGQTYGGGGEYWQPGGDGAVRIMWGTGRAFPSTNAALDGADPYMPLNLDTKQTDASVIKTVGTSSITLAGNQSLTNAQNTKYIYYAHA